MYPFNHANETQGHAGRNASERKQHGSKESPTPGQEEGGREETRTPLTEWSSASTIKANQSQPKTHTFNYTQTKTLRLAMHTRINACRNVTPWDLLFVLHNTRVVPITNTTTCCSWNHSPPAQVSVIRQWVVSLRPCKRDTRPCKPQRIRAKAAWLKGITNPKSPIPLGHDAHQN